MITLSRSQLVGAEILDEQTIRFNGVQEDHIYGMEIEMDVRIPDGRILAIKGWMKRYTIPLCPRAVDVLQDAVGMNLRQENWEQKVMRAIGRKGCQHFAEIIIECGRCLDQALMAKDLEDAVKADPALDQESFTAKWLQEHPEITGACLARPSLT
ncbi:MAG: DUF2889 domain-containing protein [Deltaproteobacteria bacterium]|nr:DUF2889 domain-containing protein [Deltaproteobacteria bacterium]